MSEGSSAKDDSVSEEQKVRPAQGGISLPTLEEAAIESYKKSFPELVRVFVISFKAFYFRSDLNITDYNECLHDHNALQSSRTSLPSYS